MTQRREIIKRISKAAKAKGMSFDMKREGGNHTVFDLDGLMIPIARHNDIDPLMAKKIYEECEPRLGKGWWRK